MTFAEFLRGMQDAQINVLVGAILALVAEFWPQYQEMDGKAKRLCFIGLCLVVPLVGAGGAVAMGYQPMSWELTFWPALWMGGTAAFATGTTVHTAFMGR